MVPERAGWKKVIHRWGGATSVFFTCAHCSHDLATTLLVPLLPLIKGGLGLSYMQSGLLISAFTITSGLSQIPMGWLGDRMNRGTVAAIGLLGVSLATLSLGLSPSYYPMLGVLVVMGIFSGAYHPSSNTILAGYYGPEQRGSVLGLHGFGGITGLTLSPVLGGLIADVLGWRYAFIILCIPAAVAAALVLKRLRLPEDVLGSGVSGRLSAVHNVSGEAGTRLSSLCRVLRPIAVITALAVLTQLIAGIVSSFIPLYVVEKHGISAVYAAMWLGVVRGGGMAGSLLGGWLSDRWGRKKVIIFVIVATGPVLYLLTMLSFGAALIVIFILFGLFMQMRQPAIQTLLMDTAPPRLRATVIGLYFFLGMEGRSLVQPVGGYFMDIWGINSVFSAIALISLGLSVVTLLGAVKLKSE